MYCSHCGKKVGDAMLFCPFCGEAIVVPEQEEAKDEQPQPDFTPIDLQTTVENDIEPNEPTIVENSDDNKDAADAAEELLNWDTIRHDAVDEWARRDEPAEPFEPLKLEEEEKTEPAEDWHAEISKKKESAQPEKKPPKIHHHGDAEPVRLDGAAPKLALDTKGAKSPAGGRKPARKHANTLVPPKTMDPNDIFMSGKNAAYDDAYDAYDDAPADGAFAFVDEEDDTGFFMRHLRGIVSLALFGILILLFIVYAFSRGGQFTLARANLAWSTEAYSQLGYQSYQDGDYSEAGLYYERALMREPNNYSFASSAAMAYYEAGNTDKSAAMLKRCIEINPTLLEPYIYLLRLYPDAAERPWDVTQLLQQGYQRTGDTRLNVTG